MLKGFSSYITSPMKIFHCDHCGHLLFFENTECVDLRPPRRLPAGPAARRVAGPSGPREPDDRWRADTWRSPLPQAADGGYRLCKTTKLKESATGRCRRRREPVLCASCRLTRMIPNLADPAHRAAWYRLEVAKRRLVFTLIELGLPVRNRTDDPERGLAFEFLADSTAGGAAGADRARRRRHHHQHRGGRRCGAREAAHGDARAVSDAARAHAARERPLLLGSPHRGDAGARRVPRTLRRRAPRLRRMRCAATTIAAPPPTGRSGSSANTRARIRGRTGPKRGRTTCTWSTRSKRPPRAASR